MEKVLKKFGEQLMKNQHGFVLVTTLWVLAMLTLAASFFALWTQRTLTIAQTRQADIQGEIDMLSTQANVIYLLTTQPFTLGGLTVPDAPDTIDKSKSYEDSILPVGTEIAVDDRSYFGHGKAFFALQDEGGLININIETEQTLGRLLGLLGVEAKLRAPLIAKLKDYIDLDDLHRANGAESYHYEQRNLPPPTNRYLKHQMETKRVLDWAEQTTLWENHQLRQLTHLYLAARSNINTAPSLVLQAAYNLSANNAERIIKMRERMPFYTLKGVFQVTGIQLDVDPLEENFFPSEYSRLTLWYAGARRMRQVHIELTPNAEKIKPWQIESSLEFELLPIYADKFPHHVQTTLFISDQLSVFSDQSSKF
ncbi:MAG: hypothetical protein DRR08_13485 [Candidatus Parabeggiatoa sp. nov. 2]|nr:MAG: hypothetical protein B6247_06175 [Beggiatoa sp. 4572_84]RKZ59603.1 MAG: hypothetical protein DRR08_13485 [Gammaproteobacteria bacterium]